MTISLNGPGADGNNGGLSGPSGPSGPNGVTAVNAVTALPMTMPIGATQEAADDDLVARLREGDRAAVEQAYVAHHAAIRGFARRLVGD